MFKATKFSVHKHGKGDGCVWISSCYLSPNEEIAVFRRKMEEIEDLCFNLDR